MAVAEEFAGQERAHVAYLAIMVLATACMPSSTDAAFPGTVDAVVVFAASAFTETVLVLLSYAHLAAHVHFSAGCVFWTCAMSGFLLRRALLPPDTGALVAAACIAAGCVFAHTMQRRAFRARGLAAPPRFQMNAAPALAAAAVLGLFATATLAWVRYEWVLLLYVGIFVLIAKHTLESTQAASFNVTVLLACSFHIFIASMYHGALGMLMAAEVGVDTNFWAACGIVLAASTTATMWP